MIVKGQANEGESCSCEKLKISQVTLEAAKAQQQWWHTGQRGMSLLGKVSRWKEL